MRKKGFAGCSGSRYEAKHQLSSGNWPLLGGKGPEKTGKGRHVLCARRAVQPEDCSWMLAPPPRSRACTSSNTASRLPSLSLKIRVHHRPQCWSSEDNLDGRLPCVVISEEKVGFPCAGRPDPAALPHHVGCLASLCLRIRRVRSCQGPPYTMISEGLPYRWCSRNGPGPNAPNSSPGSAGSVPR